MPSLSRSGACRTLAPYRVQSSKNVNLRLLGARDFRCFESTVTPRDAKSISSIGLATVRHPFRVAAADANLTVKAILHPRALKYRKATSSRWGLETPKVL